MKELMNEQRERENDIEQ